MGKRPDKKKLTVKKETLRRLELHELQQVAGGRPVTTNTYQQEP